MSFNLCEQIFSKSASCFLNNFLSIALTTLVLVVGFILAVNRVPVVFCECSEVLLTCWNKTLEFNL